MKRYKQPQRRKEDMFDPNSLMASLVVLQMEVLKRRVDELEKKLKPKKRKAS
jgi:hypothetical protein